MLINLRRCLVFFWFFFSNFERRRDGADFTWVRPERDPGLISATPDPLGTFQKLLAVLGLV